MIAGVNSRVSDAFKWIQTNVCVMSDFPPDELCADAIETITVDVEKLFWKGLAIAFGLTIIAMIATRSWLRGRKSPLEKSDSKNVEMEGLDLNSSRSLLNTTRSLSNLSSYDSIEGEEK
jgi:hypothetical protein